MVTEVSDEEWEVISSPSDRSETTDSTYVEVSFQVPEDEPTCETGYEDATVSAQQHHTSRVWKFYGVRTRTAQDGTKHFEATLPAKDSCQGSAVFLGQYPTADDAATAIQRAIANPKGAEAAAVLAAAVQQERADQGEAAQCSGSASMQPARICVDGGRHVDYMKSCGSKQEILEPSFCETTSAPPKLRSEKEKEFRKRNALAKKEVQRASGRAARVNKLVGVIDAAWQTMHPEAGIKVSEFRAGRKAACDKMMGDYGSRDRRGSDRCSARVKERNNSNHRRTMPIQVPGEVCFCEAVLDALWQTHKSGSVPNDPGHHAAGGVYSTMDFVKLWESKDALRVQCGLNDNIIDGLWNAAHSSCV